MSGTRYLPPTYPPLLAAGVAIDSTFVPFELWAGESDLVTSQGRAGANMLQFTVIARDTLNGNVIVPWNPEALEGAPVDVAAGSYTFSGAPAVNDTVTIGGNVATWMAEPNPPFPIQPSAPMAQEQVYQNAGQLIIGAATEAGVDGALTTMTAAQASALNLTQYINFFQTSLGVNALVDEATGLIVTVSANDAGTAGNAITLAKSSAAIAVSGAALTGGSVDTARELSTGQAIGFLAQPAVNGGVAVYYTGGVPNHEVLVWPLGIDTVDQRKAAFDRTNITIGKLV
jgi:hypothetical protein